MKKLILMGISTIFAGMLITGCSSSDNEQKNYPPPPPRHAPAPRPEKHYNHPHDKPGTNKTHHDVKKYPESNHHELIKDNKRKDKPYYPQQMPPK